MDVVVGLDASPAAVAVLQAGITEARLRGVRLHAVHVLYVPSAWVDGGQFAPINLYESSLQAAEALREALWQRVRPILDESGVAWSQIDLAGYPADQLVEYANSIEAGLLVVGSRGFGDLKSLLLGSTSHRVSHSASCDVLIAKVSDN